MSSRLSLAATAERPLRITPFPDADHQQYRAGYERHLGQLLINGEPAAAAGLWDHFSPMVRGLLSRTLGPSEPIEAAIEDIFFRVHQRRGRLGEAKRLRSFIVGAAVDWLRWQLRLRRWRRALARLRGSQPNADRYQFDGGPVTVHRVALAELYAALDTLTAGERLAFALHFFEGLEPAEAAALTRTSVPAFERRLLAAGKKLGGNDDDLHRLACLARAASSRPLPTSTGRATRRRFLDRVARTLPGT